MDKDEGGSPRNAPGILRVDTTRSRIVVQVWLISISFANNISNNRFLVAGNDKQSVSEVKVILTLYYTRGNSE